MKSISLLITTTLLPVLSSALVGLGWSVSGGPSTGLKDIAFPMNIANAPHEEGYYFAQQFNFVGLDDVGYTGLQPRADSSETGTSMIHAVFSSFVAGTTSTDENCSDGADGGAGVSCKVELPASYKPTYNLVIENTEGTTWTGTVVDAVSGNKTHIGSYTLPSWAGGIKDSQMGFVEYYPWNSAGYHACSSLPYTNVTFGVPTTKTSGAGKGSLDKPYQYGDCEDVGFDLNAVGDGEYEVAVGF